MLAREHRDIEYMLYELERISPAAQDQRQSMAAAVASELLRHQDTERQCLYEAVRTFVPGREELVEQVERAGVEVAQTLSALHDADSCGEHLDERIERLRPAIRLHVETQESELFPQLSKHADRGDLEWLGDRVQAVRAAQADSLSAEATS